MTKEKTRIEADPDILKKGRLDLDIRGELHLTPAISKEMDFNIRDIEPILRSKARKAGVELYIRYEVVSDGMIISWGPSSDLESTEGLKTFK